MVAKLISCREADRMYRMRNGTAAAAAKANQIPSRRRGRAILISAKRADELWGVDGALIIPPVNDRIPHE